MLSAILAFFGLRKAGLIAIGVSVAVALLAIGGGVLAWKIMGWRLEAARAELALQTREAARMREVAEGERAVRAEILADAARQAAIADRRIAEESARAAFYLDNQSKIIAAADPPRDCVGPAVRAALDGLRRREADGHSD